MKTIALASKDQALDQAISLLFKGRYQITGLNSIDKNSNLLDLNPIDLLIVDVKAIDEDVLKKIFLLKKMKTNLPIIMLYDLKVPEYVKSDLFPLADVMFRKPFSNQQLLNAVNDFLVKEANFN
ncbi:MAG: hypothetical protein GXO74_03820 [Calditrichaeota bacterium]|nr:hypothetical protein [Calditrichota bacterium]